MRGGRLANSPCPKPHNAGRCLALACAACAAYVVCAACVACVACVVCAACVVYVVCAAYAACAAYASGRYTCPLRSWQYSGCVDKKGIEKQRINVLTLLGGTCKIGV